MADWLLIETFGGQPSTIIGAGSRPRRWVPLDKLRQGDLIQQTLNQCGTERVDLTLSRGYRRLIVEPLIAFNGNRHGAWVWCARTTDEVPPHDLAGAWHFNLTTDEIGGSDDLLDLYRQPESERHKNRRTAEAFTRLITNDDVTAAFAIIVKSPVGAEHQAVWTVRCDDGAERAAHFSCRAIASENNEIVLHGLTHDIGPASTTEAAPGPVVLERRMLEAFAEPDTYRAVVNIRTGRIIRWEDNPPEDFDWTSLDHPFICPDDESLLTALHEGLAEGRSEQVLRLRTTAGTWQPSRVVAHPVLLDATTTAAFWTIHHKVAL